MRVSMRDYSYINKKGNKMFQIKVTNNDNSEKVLSFKEFTRTVVLAKYGQLISEGEIKDFQLV